MSGRPKHFFSIYQKMETQNLLYDQIYDLVAFRIPDAVFQALLRDAPFARHFADALSDRLKAALAQSPVATFRPDLGLEVRQLVRDPPVWVDAGATVGDAARAMRAGNATAVLVRGERPAIVTDRDFRNRVLAEALPGDTAAGLVASGPLRTVPAETPVYEAWLTLLDAGLHHLPVVRATTWLQPGERTSCVGCHEHRMSAPPPATLARASTRRAARCRIAAAPTATARRLGTATAPTSSGWPTPVGRTA